MSTGKSIRKYYDDTFKKLTETSGSYKKLRYLTDQVKNPSATLNLPLTLTDARVKLFASPKTANSAKKPSKRKTAEAPEINKAPSKKPRRK